MERRKFIRNSFWLGLGTGMFKAGNGSMDQQNAKGSFRVAFLSDIHVKPTDIAEEGMRKAFRHVNALHPKPRFILNGGDSIMDAMKAEKPKVEKQWEIWNRVLDQENRLPIYHAIGNHDAWGWQLTDPEIKKDPLYDKGWVMQQHKMPGRYYCFEKEGWKFIVLDSAHENNGGYIARIDDTQYMWLEMELQKTNKDQHICIVSHIPIVSFCSAMFADENQANGDWRISRALLHTDARRLVTLFGDFPNIKCCLSGHIHLQDAVEYKGISYYCNGAVSGNWWNGAFKGFNPAYALFTFTKKGDVSREIIYY